MTYWSLRSRLDRIETADAELVYDVDGGMMERIDEVRARLATVTIIDDRDPAAEAETADRMLAEAHTRLAAAEAVVAEHRSGRWLPAWPSTRAQRETMRAAADIDLERAQFMLRVATFRR